MTSSHLSPSSVFSFEVTVKGTLWVSIINARSAGRAKAEYYRSVTESWPDIPFTSIRARKIGLPYTSPNFARNAEYRGLPGLKCGQRVRVGAGLGVIVSSNSSANMDVLFDDDSPQYSGLTLNVHPDSLTLL